MMPRPVSVSGFIDWGSGGGGVDWGRVGMEVIGSYMDNIIIMRRFYALVLDAPAPHLQCLHRFK